MKKILFITPDFYPNSTGFANASTNLIDSICKYGNAVYEIWVFTTITLNGNIEKDGIHVIRYSSSIPVNRFTYRFSEYKKARVVEQIIERNGIDVIFFETNTFPFFQNYLLDKYQEKIVVRIHSTADTEVPVYSPTNNLLSKQCRKKIFEFMAGVKHIVSTSNYYLDFVRHHFLEDNVYKVWNNKTYGLIFNTAGDDIEAKSPYFVNTFMTMGKMSANGVTQKGIEDLVNAIYLIKKDNKLPPDFHLNIVGTGECLSKIQGLIFLLKLENEVTIVESATNEQVFEMMSSSKAVVLLSRYEGQSMFITEALANAKPIIITGNNGMQDLLIDNYNGKVVQTGVPMDAAKVLFDFMSLSDEDICEMGKNSFDLYRRNYSTKATFDQFNDTINKILS